MGMVDPTTGVDKAGDALTDSIDCGEIIPGQRVGPFQLGAPWHQLERALPRYELERRSGCFVAKLPSIWLFVDEATQHLQQITVLNQFRGRIGQMIGLGSTGTQVASALGPWQEDESDNLFIPEYPGLCFAVAFVPGHDVDWQLLHAPIAAISVYR